MGKLDPFIFAQSQEKGLEIGLSLRKWEKLTILYQRVNPSGYTSCNPSKIRDLELFEIPCTRSREQIPLAACPLFFSLSISCNGDRAIAREFRLRSTRIAHP
ncbi:hypothetical protein IQ249_09675 [Lusitaniella coriacea LEGE 07157]|uniref:Uncharacterized protein n=1 Tax=Lusitaniella coriacea LEGE 07157 TaxID=945747 RepID=A0A8J7DWL9_9CYAN|nr:hypothetical protein [Lusitaniella coriacea]MBE9116163.1 hypothetical protein [Lusitaniella coriacea LEGE 07157]